MIAVLSKHRLKETRESVDGTLAKMQTRDADLIDQRTPPITPVPEPTPRARLNATSKQS